MVAAMIERTDRTTTVTVIEARAETVVLDCYCPTCRSGYLGSVRFRADAMPPPGCVHHRGYCNGCRKWRWADAADGVRRVDGRSGQR